MTFQISTKVRYGSSYYTTEQLPLAEIVNKKDAPKLVLGASNNWKAYEAEWVIRDKELVLIDFKANGKKGKLKIGDFIKDARTPLVATWYTGKIHITLGDFDRKNYRWPAIISLVLKKGKVVNIELRKDVHELDPEIDEWNGLPRKGKKEASTPEK